MLAADAQVATHELGHLVNVRPSNLLNQPGRRTKGKLDKRAATSAASTGWNFHPAGTGITGSLAICCTSFKSDS
jgi:hypothetical protein